ncbi:hypothetical protein BUY29_06805 [Staphylococcus cohnii]|nr:hypothetical protein BUY29_06805 [Staphylococcus cohnii]
MLSITRCFDSTFNVEIGINVDILQFSFQCSFVSITRINSTGFGFESQELFKINFKACFEILFCVSFCFVRQVNTIHA